MVKSLKTKTVHTVTKGKRHSAGCNVNKQINKQTKIHTKTGEWVSERNIVMMDECFWINAPQWCAWQKTKTKQKRQAKSTENYLGESKAIQSNNYSLKATNQYSDDALCKATISRSASIPILTAYSKRSQFSYKSTSITQQANPVTLPRLKRHVYVKTKTGKLKRQVSTSKNSPFEAASLSRKSYLKRQVSSVRL